MGGIMKFHIKTRMIINGVLSVTISTLLAMGIVYFLVQKQSKQRTDNRIEHARHVISSQLESKKVDLIRAAETLGKSKSLNKILGLVWDLIDANQSIAYSTKELAINISDISYALGLSKAVIYDVNGKWIGAVVINSDEMRLLAAKEPGVIDHLRYANKELEAFTFSAAHDLRKPLLHITGFVKLLLKREQQHLDDKSLHYLSVISKSAQDMNQLIDDLLRLSYVGKADTQEGCREIIKMNSLVQNVREELTMVWANRRLVWLVHPMPDALGDINLIRQVWMNLLSNAVKFTSTVQSAHIEIGYLNKPNPNNEHEKDVITYFIRDNGVGFDPAYMDKLFKPFQRLHGKTEFPGNGIGLSIVQRILVMHGENVWAEGQPNRGATFYFTLQKTYADA